MIIPKFQQDNSSSTKPLQKEHNPICLALLPQTKSLVEIHSAYSEGFFFPPQLVTIQS